MTRELTQEVLVSILNWNGAEDTAACLRSLGRIADPRIRLLVLDNGSCEDPTARLEHEFPDVEFRREPINLGFTGGHNLAIELALQRGYGSVMLLNNDCKITTRAILEMQRCLDDDPRLAAVSPMILRDDATRKAIAAGGWVDWTEHRSVWSSSSKAVPPLGLPILLAGTALLLRCVALRKIGVLDDRYFAYYEDNDISARIAAAGYQALYCTTAYCLHRFRNPEDYGTMALYLSSRNAWLFWRTHTPARFRRGMYRNLLVKLLEDVAVLKKRSAAREKLEAMLDGFWDAQRGRFGRPPAKLSSPWLLRRAAILAPWWLSKVVRSPLRAIVDKIRVRRAV